MEKYKTFKNIDKRDISLFEGLGNEQLTSIIPDSNQTPAPLLIESFGITFPTKNYRIARKNSNYFVLEFVVSGKGTLIIDGKHYSVGANDAYLLPRGSSHEYYAGKTAPFLKYWINFKSDVFYDIYKAYGLENTFYFHNVDLKEDFLKIFELEKISVLNTDIYVKCSEILFGIFMKLAEKTKKSDSVSEVAQQIRLQLDKGVSSKITLEEICKTLYISRSKLIREFKKYYKIPPYEYLLQMKISFAKTLLKNTSYTIKHIAERLDFADEHYFSFFFKEKVGVSPSEYRNSPN